MSRYLTRADVSALRQSQARSIPAYRTTDFTIENLRRMQTPAVSRRALRKPSPAPTADDACWQYQLGVHRSRARTKPTPQADTWYVKKTGRQMIEGACSSGAVDGAREILVPAGMECSGLPLPIFWEHDESKPAGEIVYLKRLPGVVFCRGIVDERESNLWGAIEAGDICNFSVHADPLEPPVERADGVRIFTRWQLREVSIVRRGANPEAVFYPYTPPNRRPVYLNNT